MRTVFITVIIFLFLSLSTFAFSQNPAQEAQIIGQIFGSPVPVGNYYFIKSTLIVFGNRWGGQPKSAEELDNAIWEHLVLSFEAFRRNITVTPEEREQEIAKILEGEKVSFDWKKDKEAYTKWVKEKTGEDAELFENQLSHLLQLQKLRNQAMEGINPVVTEEESREAFLNEQNSIELELAQFEEKSAADEFYNKVKKEAKSWDEERGRGPDRFKRPGFVTLVFLIDFWKIAKDDLYQMMKAEAGSIYPPASIYKGFAVFKVLNKKVADETSYPQMKYSYRDKVVAMKKYGGLGEWIKKLKADANITIYRQGG